MQITFRKLTESDIDICLGIMKENYPDEKDKLWQDMLPKDLSDVLNKVYPSDCLLAIRDDIIIGFGCYIQLKRQPNGINKNVYKLTWINISPKEQGKGIGRQLVIELEKSIKECTVGEFNITIETDKPLFYEKLGYNTFFKIVDKYIMAK